MSFAHFVSNVWQDNNIIFRALKTLDVTAAVKGMQFFVFTFAILS